MSVLTLPVQDVLLNEESEMALIGSVFINPVAFDYVAPIIESSQAFFLIKHQYIWDAITDIKAKNEPVDDVIVIADKLESRNQLDVIGGRAYLLQLANTVGTHTNATVYAEIVQRLYIRRKIAQASDEIKAIAHDTDIDIDKVTALSEDVLFRAGGTRQVKFGGRAADVMNELYEQFESMLKDDRTIPGLSTGIIALDDVMLGFEPEQLSIWAGRPGMGKSSAFISFVYHRARLGEFVLFFSSEMSKEKVMMRLWSMDSGIPVKRLKIPRLMNANERKKATESWGRVGAFDLFIDDTPNPQPRHVRTMTKIYMERYGLKVIFVDGIYTMRPNRDLKSQVLNVGSISADLREIARFFSIHVATTHQLSRKVEERQDKRPMLSDLRDSGQLEQDADKVVFLYRDEMYNDASERPGQIDFITAKHRDGATGTCSAYFNKEIMRVQNGSFHRVDLSDLD